MSRPLVVDLDGTLLRSDMLIESMLGYLKQDRASLLQLPLWLLKGKAPLKEQLASRVRIDVTSLPYNKEVLSFLRHARSEERHIVLATATHRIYAEQIAHHLGLFNQIIATAGSRNISSRTKRDRLVEQFGEKGFDYIGNSHDDLPVLESAQKAYLSDPDRGVTSKATKAGNIERIFTSRQTRLKAWIRALRPHQWLKNLLIFIPVLANHQVLNLTMLLQALLAFALFSMTASSGYLFNDLLDLESDRHHPRKRLRALASGELPLQLGIVSAPLLFITAALVSMMLMPVPFSISLAAYYVLTVAYSRFLKSQMGIDTIALAGLYTVRIIAGAYACGLVPTFWILAFSLFLFLSLAMVKRYAELVDARSKGKTEQTRGRGYFPADLEIIANLGSSSGYLSVLVLALYIQDPRTLVMYRTHELIWLACPILLFWISRMWMITHRGQMHDDPVLFAIRDRVSLLTGALFGAVFMLASFL